MSRHVMAAILDLKVWRSRDAERKRISKISPDKT